MRDGRRHGVGTCTWELPDAIYKGDWVQGVRHGNGLYETEDGQEYEGQWVNDQRHGFGRLTDHYDGSVTEGTWRNDKLHGIVEIALDGEVTRTVYQEGTEIKIHSSNISGLNIIYLVIAVTLFAAFCTLLYFCIVPPGRNFGGPPVWALLPVIILPMIYWMFSCIPCGEYTLAPACQYMANRVPVAEALTNLEHYYERTP